VVKGGLATVAVLAAVLAPAAGATTTTVDPHGTVLVDGQKVFPIVLAKGPEPGMVTPAGSDGLTEVAAAGVNFFKTGPAQDPWPPPDEIPAAIAYQRAAAALGVYTWVNLATLSDASPNTLKEQRIREVVAALEGDWSASALGMWKGADEPFWGGRPPSMLWFAYCLGTSRGEASWCANETPADEDHLWVTIQAPRGNAEDLEPYTDVTDIHGVDHYPVTWAEQADPALHEIGTWTDTIASVTPSGAVWTTLQICASGSSNPDNLEQYVVPTPRQERYMIYDAIINGARSLAFYGGNIFRCWNDQDEELGWNWWFWENVLEDLVGEINAASPIAPALVNPGTTQALPANDATTQVIMRHGTSPSDLWVIAARHGAGSEPVTISGLPASVESGTVYTEGRSIAVQNGSFTDTFARWDVHVYRFTVPPPAPPPAPPPPQPPASPPPPPPVLTSTPPRPGPRVVLGGVRSTRARSGRIFRIELRLLTDTGGPPPRGPVRCAATVARRGVRVRAKGWQSGRPYCSWRLPRASRGKRLRGVVRVDGLVYRFTRRIGV
jgi:hypothetical protein